MRGARRRDALADPWYDVLDECPQHLGIRRAHENEPEVQREAGEQAEGKIGRIGLSQVSVPEIQAAKAITPIATVQNLYNLSDRSAEPILDFCEREGIGFIPWFPMATGRLARPGGPLQRIADEHAVTPAQLALAWLLQRSPVLLPIPGNLHRRTPRRERRCGADRAHRRPSPTTRHRDLMALKTANPEGSVMNDLLNTAIEAHGGLERDP